MDSPLFSPLDVPLGCVFDGMCWYWTFGGIVECWKEGLLNICLGRACVLPPSVPDLGEDAVWCSVVEVDWVNQGLTQRPLLSPSLHIPYFCLHSLSKNQQVGIRPLGHSSRMYIG